MDRISIFHQYECHRMNALRQIYPALTIRQHDLLQVIKHKINRLSEEMTKSDQR